MLVPLFYLGVRAFEAEPDRIVALVWRWRTAELLLNTAWLTLAVIALTTAIALPLAWLVTRTDLRYPQLVTVVATLPLAVPGYVMAFALLGLAGHSGFMNQIFGIRLPRPEGLVGATLALSLYTYPYLFLNLRAALAGMDPGLDESARTLGCTPRQTFFRVTLPHLKPALFAGWLVIGLYVIGDFGAVALMRYEAFSYVIYTQYAAAFDRIYAAWLALILVSIALVFVVLEGYVRDRNRYARTAHGTARLRVRAKLGWWAVPAWLFIALVVMAALGLPLLVLGFWISLAPVAPALPELLQSFTHSLSAALPAALVAVLFALPVAVLGVRYPSPIARVVDRLAFIGYAVPPLAFALAMVFLALSSLPLLYQTLTLLVLAYALNFLPLALGPLRATLYQVPKSMEDAARTLGYGPLKVFWHIILPLTRRGMVVATVMVFVIAMKELPIAFLLAPTGFRSLAIVMFGRTSEGMLLQAAPYALLIVVLSSAVVWLVFRQEGRS
ncbi:MAG: iron ABC transporter permease [Geminicoccaceae bacterium]|nr:MAG: iron ABC transporter permease [Geminicoccaceae bacterium]